MRKAALAPNYSYKLFLESAARANLTPSKFAEAVGISMDSVGQWRRGQSGMSHAAKARIEEYFRDTMRPEMAVLLQPWDKSFRWAA
jgi:transcriptional regulator with XRE-family HTH domain